MVDMAMIEIDNVSKSYSKDGGVTVHALRGTSLSIAKGEFLAIMGPSGSGKSTLMNILGLLDRPDSGSYRIDQQEVGSLSVDELAHLRNEKIGFVFQAFHLLPRTTAVENVELPLVYARGGMSREKAVTALQRVGLEDRAGHYSSELSGGQQQRVAIARALVNDPEILFADEPTGNLDSAAGDEVMKIFAELVGMGKTVILITHEPDIAAQADRVVRIVDGEIVADERKGDAKTAAPAPATSNGDSQ
jgi:putative ABC transport system ATP-binding protein